MAKAATKDKKTSTAVAVKKTINIVSLQDEIKKEIAAAAEATGAPGGDQIFVTQNKTFKLPDGTETGGPIEVVIVDYVTLRAYYDRAFDQKNPCPPACAALSRNVNGMVPFKESPDKQSQQCSGCPMNEWESADSGKGKACKEHRVLAVIPGDADATTELSILRISPTALKAFDAYVRTLSSATQKAPFQVVTKISFDPNQTYASLRFGDPVPCNEDLLAVAFSMRDAARARLLTQPDFSGYTKPVKKGRR